MGENVNAGWYVEGDGDFPICNHTKEVGTENTGYQTGMFCDGLPFEAEIYEYGQNDTYMKELAIIFPDMYVDEDDVEDYEYELESIEISDDEELDWGYNEYYRKVPATNIEEFHYEVELKDLCVLPIGMVLRGQESNFSIIKWYQEFIEEMGILEYTSDYRNCAVFYYTDINGNDLVQVRIGLITNGNEEAKTNITFKPFPNLYKNSELNDIRFKVVK